MKRNLMRTERGFQRTVAAQEARYQATQATSQEEVEAELAGCEKYLKERGNKRYFVFWRPGSREALVSREWRV